MKRKKKKSSGLDSDKEVIKACQVISSFLNIPVAPDISTRNIKIAGIAYENSFFLGLSKQGVPVGSFFKVIARTHKVDLKGVVLLTKLRELQLLIDKTEYPKLIEKFKELLDDLQK